MKAEAAPSSARRLLLGGIQRCKWKVRAPLQPVAAGQCVQGPSFVSWQLGCNGVQADVNLHFIQDSLTLRQQQQTAARVLQEHVSQGADSSTGRLLHARLTPIALRTSSPNQRARPWPQARLAGCLL